jgi:O-antigen ligase
VTAVGLLLGLGVLGALALGLLDGFVRKPHWAIYAALAADLGDIAFDVRQEVVVGGVTIWSYDVIACLLVGAALLRLLRRPDRELGTPTLLAFGLLGLLVLSLLRGIAAFGLQAAVNDFREWFFYLAAILYFATVPFDEVLEARIMRALRITAVVLVGLVLARWASKATGLPLGPFALGERAIDRVYGIEDYRVIHANDTFVLLQVGLVYLMRWRHDVTRSNLRMASIMIAIAIGLQHRTVWIAMLVAFGIVFARHRALAGRLAVFFTALVVLAAGGLLATAGPDGLAESAAPTEAISSIELGDGALAGNTFVWRYEGWVALLEQVDWSDPLQVALGEPFGSGYERRIRGQTVDISPHSAYVTAFLRTGLLGLSAFLAILWMAASSLLRRNRQRAWLSDEILAVLVIAQAVFLITYNPSSFFGSFLGLAVGSLAQRRRHARAVLPAGPVRRPVEVPSGA